MYNPLTGLYEQCSETWLISVANTAELKLVEDGIKAALKALDGTIALEQAPETQAA